MRPPLTRCKTCLDCGKDYVPVSNRQRYCPECGRRGKGRCEVCGINFRKVGNSSGRFCSRACQLKHVLAAKTRTCPICGKSFVARSVTTHKVTCGPECADKYRRKPRANCLICGKPCNRRLSTYCSRTCLMTGRNRKGEKRRPDGFIRPGGNGYMAIKVNGRWMMQHRHVMEQSLGRPLEKHERVHHKNGNRADNRPENLELWKVKKKDPAGIRSADYHCPGCRCFEHKE